MTLAPAPFSESLHWFTEVVSVLYDVVVGPTQELGTVFAGP
ncbi:hypothetical protein [Glaciihabitans sp. GrIS 2.15]